MPRTRVSVPEDHVAVVLHRNVAEELVRLMLLIRQNRKIKHGPSDNGASLIANDVLLALLDAKERMS